MAKITDVVKLKAGYANFVELKSAFEEAQENTERMAMYRPTKSHRKAFERLCRGLYQPNDKKFYLLSGSYGTGKSHLCLMFANFLSRSSGDPEIKGFYENYKKLDPETAKTLTNVRKDGQFLVAICDYHSGRRFEDVVLKAVFDACQAKGLDTGIKTEFDEAERLLSDWEKQLGSDKKQLIRVFYEDFQKALEKVTPDLSVEQLRKSLKGYDSHAMEIFRAAFKETMGGMEFQAQAGNLIPILRELVRSKVFKEKFKGLAIFFDEFGFTLEKGSYSKDLLQGFMETICKNEPNVVFVGCIHKDFKAYADKFSKDDVAVMNARITHVDLLNEGIEEIIGAIVEIDKDSQVWKQEIQPKTGVFDQLVPYCKTLNLFPWIEDVNRIRQRVLEDIYGVHPMALACLLRLSSEIGSDARSTFTFFSGDVGGAEGSYADFIGNAPLIVGGGKLNLYTVDHLFNFFKRELSLKNPELRERQRQIVNGFYASLEAFRKGDDKGLFDEQANERVSVLRTILLYQLCQIPTDLENIQFGLYCLTKAEQKQIENHLKYLTKCGSVFYRQQSKTYELAVGTGEDPYDLIERYLQDESLHPTDMVDTFLKVAGEGQDIEFLEAKQYNLHFNEDKRFERYFVRPKDLGNTFWEGLRKHREENSNKAKKSYEGAVVYALCEDDAEIQVAKSAVQNIPDPNITVAVPHEPQPFTETLLKVRACMQYLPPNEKEKISAQTESRLRDILDNADDGYLPQLQRILDSVINGDSACWYGQGGKVVVDIPKQSHKAVDVLCEDLYKKRCRIKHPDINFLHDDKWQTGKNNALKQAVAALLETEKVIIDNGNPDNHGQKRYLEQVLLKGAGALRKTGASGTVNFFECESNSVKISEDFPVLKEFCRRLNELKPGITFSIGSFLEEAKSSPYGASGTLLVLASAHVVRAFGERLRIYKDSTKTVEITISNYEDLLEIVGNPATKVVFEIRDIKANQAKLVDGVAKAVHAPPLMHGENRSLNSAYEALKKWWQDIPPVAKIIEIYEKDRQKRLKKLTDVLSSIEDTDRFDLLLDRLPSVYIDGPEGGDLKEKETSYICDEFASDVKLFESGLHLVRNDVSKAICEVFDSKGDLVECEATVTSWFESLSPVQRDYLNYGDHPEAETLMKHLADSKMTFESKVMTAIPSGFGLEPVKDWNSIKVADYVAKWRQAKKLIEEAAVVIGMPTIKKVNKAREIEGNRWEVESGGSIELALPENATAIIYTANGDDPRKSDARRLMQGNVILESEFKDVPRVKIIARAIDAQGNASAPFVLSVTNKTKEYDVVIHQEDLYIREGTFKFPENFQAFISVVKSLVDKAQKEKLITSSQAEKLNKLLDNL